MVIPTIVALAPSILKSLYGLKGMFDYGGAKRPKYEIPQSVNEAEGIYKYLAGADIAGKKEAEAGIFQSQGNILDTLTQNVSSSSALLNAASGIQGQTNKALTDLDIASAQQKAQGTATLANFLQGTKAQYEDKQWQINEYQPFLDEAQAAQKATENLWGGLKEVGGGLLDIEQANTYKELNKTNQAMQKAWIDKMFPSNTDVTETPNINTQPQNNVTAPVISNERTIGEIIGGVENINEDLFGENATKYDAILGIKNAIASKITEAQQEVTNTSNINLASTFLGVPNEIKSVPEVLNEKLGNMTLKDLLSPKSITNNNIDYEEPISRIDEARGFMMNKKYSYSNPYKGNIYESNITKEDISKGQDQSLVKDIQTKQEQITNNKPVEDDVQERQNNMDKVKSLSGYINDNSSKNILSDKRNDNTNKLKEILETQIKEDTKKQTDLEQKSKKEEIIKTDDVNKEVISGDKIKTYDYNIISSIKEKDINPNKLDNETFIITKTLNESGVKPYIDEYLGGDNMLTDFSISRAELNESDIDSKKTIYVIDGLNSAYYDIITNEKDEYIKSKINSLKSKVKESEDEYNKNKTEKNKKRLDNINQKLQQAEDNSDFYYKLEIGEKESPKYLTTDKVEYKDRKMFTKDEYLDKFKYEGLRDALDRFYLLNENGFNKDILKKYIKKYLPNKTK